MFANGTTAEQMRATIEAFRETAGFNKTAAILTTVSVALGCRGPLTRQLRGLAIQAICPITAILEN
jgi:hypothetical protein